MKSDLTRDSYHFFLGVLKQRRSGPNSGTSLEVLAGLMGKGAEGSDCGSDHELLIAKFRPKLKKIGKSTRPFRYDLNQIPYNYTVEVTDRFEALDLIYRVPEELCTEVRDIVQKAVIKTIPKKKKLQKGKMVSEEALQIAVKRREAKGKGEKERYSHLNAEFQRMARRDKKAFFSDQCKEIEEMEWERLEISSRKLKIPREYFMQNGHNKRKKWYGTNRSRRY